MLGWRETLHQMLVGSSGVDVMLIIQTYRIVCIAWSSKYKGNEERGTYIPRRDH